MTNSKFISKEKVKANIYRLRFSKPFIDKYQAGEFIQITLNLSKDDDRGNKRWFTLTSLTTDDYVEITTRYFNKKSSAFKQELFNLKEGDDLHISTPMGDFVLPKNRKLKLMFVAAGIGITPFTAMNKSIEHNKYNVESFLLWKLNTKDEEFNVLSKNKEVLFNNSKKKFNSEYIYKKYMELDYDRLYISGAESMVEQFRADLINLGIKENKIYSDYFPGYSSNN